MGIPRCPWGFPKDAVGSRFLVFRDRDDHLEKPEALNKQSNHMLKIFQNLLLALVALLVIGVVAVWAPDRPVEDLTARWAPQPSQFVAIDGMNVHLRDEGPRDDPEPIILLHGTGASLHTWDGWTDVLKARHRVIRVDLPGFGLTGPTKDGNYQMPVYTHFMNSLMDMLQIKRAILAGNSFGGDVSWQTAVTYPDRVSRLILVDSSGYATTAASVPIAFKLAQMPLLSRLLSNILPRSVVESSVRNVYADPSKVTPELVDRYYELALRAGNRKAITQRFAQNKPGQNETAIKQVKVPTLIIWGGLDRLITPDNAEKFHRDIVGSQLIVFEKLGHVGHEEDPAATGAAVQAFLGK
jgi:pimeloyl-ACP methyl ester carboxylesterase